jgi:hypothetical protein
VLSPRSGQRRGCASPCLGSVVPRIARARPHSPRPSRLAFQLKTISAALLLPRLSCQSADGVPRVTVCLCRGVSFPCDRGGGCGWDVEALRLEEAITGKGGTRVGWSWLTSALQVRVIPLLFEAVSDALYPRSHPQTLRPCPSALATRFQGCRGGVGAWKYGSNSGARADGLMGYHRFVVSYYYWDPQCPTLLRFPNPVTCGG